MPIIEVKNLYKSYSRRAVLRDLNLSVEEGDHLYIVGENGTGKSTLIKLLLGLIEPDSGEIVFSKNRKTKIGYLPQQTEIQTDFPASVREVVLSGTLGGKRLPLYTARDKKLARDMMEKLNVSDIERRSFRELSGGQQQRVLLARALCATGGILLLDEPITGLDPVATAEFYRLTEQLHSEGVTIITVSHDVSCAVHYGNKILHLGHGEYFFGSSHEYAHSALGKAMLAGGHCHD
ncbi:MAG: metal ABC transporter ATP-binding protein [Clostridia bacterium]|nr:metal ABC transporter ATP-binding protein [Clostridia bacterium]